MAPAGQALQGRLLHFLLWALAAALLAGASAGRPLRQFFAGNVDLEATPAARAQTLWALSEIVLNDLERQSVAEMDGAYLQRFENTRRFMLHVAWLESGGLRWPQQLRGPARSLYQIEPIRALSCCRTAGQRGWLDEMAGACRLSQPELAAACGELSASDWGAGHVVEQCLVGSDLFATYMARACLDPVSVPLSNRLERQAAYWAALWKRVFRDDAQRSRLQQRFIEAAEEADSHIPPTIYP